MGCSGGVAQGEVACGCSGQTVFEGAVIGQVFTGNVQMRCPRLEGPYALPDHSRTIFAVALLLLIVGIYTSQLSLDARDLATGYAAVKLVGLLSRRFDRSRAARSCLSSSNANAMTDLQSCGCSNTES